MSVITTYDNMRDELKSTLEKALKQSKELVMGDDIWGYDEMRDGYAMELYTKIKSAIDAV